jgi:hypothetical protein
VDNRYYDSCLFGNATNPSHADYAGCVRATTVEDITWGVSCCPDVISAEFPSVSEFVDQFLVYCSLNGIVAMQISLAECKQAAKKNRSHKKPLVQLGFDGHDWNHLMAAVFADCNEIRTTDEDFFDPANKAARGSARKATRVSDYISDKFGIEVLRP